MRLSRSLGKMALASLLSVGTVSTIVTVPHAAIADVAVAANNPYLTIASDSSNYAHLEVTPDFDTNGRLTGTVHLMVRYASPYFNSDPTVYLINPSITASNISYKDAQVQAFNLRTLRVDSPIYVAGNSLTGAQQIWSSQMTIGSDKSFTEAGAYGFAPQQYASNISSFVPHDHELRIDFNQAVISADTDVTIAAQAADPFGQLQKDSKGRYAANYVRRSLNGWNNYSANFMGFDGDNTKLTAMANKLWGHREDKQLSNAGFSTNIDGQEVALNQAWPVVKHAMTESARQILNNLSDLGPGEYNDQVRAALVNYLGSHEFTSSQEIADFTNQAQNLASASANDDAAKTPVSDTLKKLLDDAFSTTYPGTKDIITDKIGDATTVGDLRSVIENLPDINNAARNTADTQAQQFSIQAQQLAQQVLDARSTAAAKDLVSQVAGLLKKAQDLQSTGGTTTAKAINEIQAAYATAQANYTTVANRINTSLSIINGAQTEVIAANSGAGTAKDINEINSIIAHLNSANNEALAAKNDAKADEVDTVYDKFKVIFDSAMANAKTNQERIRKFDEELNNQIAQVLQASADAIEEANKALAAKTSAEAEEHANAAKAKLDAVRDERMLTSETAQHFGDAETAVGKAEDYVQTLKSQETDTAARTAVDKELAESAAKVEANLQAARNAATATDAANLASDSKKIVDDMIAKAVNGTSASAESLTKAQKDLADINAAAAARTVIGLEGNVPNANVSDLASLQTAAQTALESARTAADAGNTNRDTNEDVKKAEAAYNRMTQAIAARIADALASTKASIDDAYGVISRGAAFGEYVSGLASGMKAKDSASQDAYDSIRAAIDTNVNTLKGYKTSADAAKAKYTNDKSIEDMNSLAAELGNLSNSTVGTAQTLRKLFIALLSFVAGADSDPNLGDWDSYGFGDAPITGGGTGSSTTTTTNPSTPSTGGSDSTNPGDDSAKSTEPTTSNADAPTTTGASTPSTQDSGTQEPGSQSPRTSTPITQADRNEATAIITGLAGLSDAERTSYTTNIAAADDMETLLVIVRDAIVQNATNSGVNADNLNTIRTDVNSDKTLDELRARANTYLNAYDAGEVTAPSTSQQQTQESTPSKKGFNWIAVILALLGVGGAGALGWGYVHDADFRAVVDGAIANVQRAIDQALGRR
ncbi:MAG: hypothetical protein Q3962_04150 [Corynebacterium sp.]|nr:hypothetical protein [Corynebacterium sp.]